MDKLIQMIQDSLYNDNVTKASKITELGGDSLSITSLLIDIELEFEIELGFDELLSEQTIEDLWHLIEKKQES